MGRKTWRKFFKESCETIDGFSFFFFFFFGRNFDELEDCYSSSIYLLNIIPRRRDFIRSNVLFKTVMV